jgi:hypothetical protein
MAENGLGRADGDGYAAGMPGLEDFDRYVAERRRARIPEDDYPAAFALWIAEVTGGPVPRFEKVERETSKVLPDREQRELDSLPSRLAIRYERHY